MKYITPPPKKIGGNIGSLLPFGAGKCEFFFVSLHFVVLVAVHSKLSLEAMNHVW